MVRHLVFRLHGSLASWGGVAMGDVRGTDSVPSRSALLGILSASLGLRREQQDALAELGRSLSFAVRVDREGESLSDYHTVSSASDTALKESQKVGVVARTRKEEVEAAARRSENVMLTTRWYRMDVAYTVAVVLRDGATYGLEDLGAALRSPRFNLSMGRKSCPLGWPMAPEVIEAVDAIEAIRLYDAVDAARFDAVEAFGAVATLATAPLKKRGGTVAERVLAWEDGVIIPGSVGTIQKAGRFDEPVNRLRWQFAQRREYRSIWPEVK